MLAEQGQGFVIIRRISGHGPLDIKESRLPKDLRCSQDIYSRGLIGASSVTTMWKSRSRVIILLLAPFNP